MCDLADVVELQSWTPLFVGFVPYLYESQVREFYNNIVIEENSILTTKVGEIKLVLSKKVLPEVLKVQCEGISQLLEGHVLKVLWKKLGIRLT